MKKNVGSVDRIVRLVLAAVFAVLYITKTVNGTLGVVLIVFGGILAATSIMNFCPLYRLLGINSSKKP